LPAPGSNYGPLEMGTQTNYVSIQLPVSTVDYVTLPEKKSQYIGLPVTESDYEGLPNADDYGGFETNGVHSEYRGFDTNNKPKYVSIPNEGSSSDYGGFENAKKGSNSDYGALIIKTNDSPKQTGYDHMPSKDQKTTYGTIPIENLTPVRPKTTAQYNEIPSNLSPPMKQQPKEDITNPLWYCGEIDRNIAEAYLQKISFDCFLVRLSKSTNNYTISKFSKLKNQFFHIILARDANGWKLEKSNDKATYSTFIQLMNTSNELKGYLPLYANK